MENLEERVAILEHIVARQAAFILKLMEPERKLAEGATDVSRTEIFF